MQGRGRACSMEAEHQDRRQAIQQGAEAAGGGPGRHPAYLAEIQRLLLLEMRAWPLLPVGDGSGRAP